jgi:preprotein translocase subunit SecF
MIKNRSKICLMVSCAIMAVALVLSVFGLGINFGIDFAGGLSMQYAMGGEYRRLCDMQKMKRDE